MRTIFKSQGLRGIFFGERDKSERRSILGESDTHQGKLRGYWRGLISRIWHEGEELPFGGEFDTLARTGVSSVRTGILINEHCSGESQKN